MRSKVWNTDTKFVAFKNKYEDKSKKLIYLFIQVWSVGLQKLTKMIENHVHIRSTDHFKQVGLHGKMTNEINSVDDRCVWLCIRVTFSSSIGKVLELPDG